MGPNTAHSFFCRTLFPGLAPALHCGLQDFFLPACEVVTVSQHQRESFVLLKRFYSILSPLPNFDPLARVEKEERQFLIPTPVVQLFSWTPPPESYKRSCSVLQSIEQCEMKCSVCSKVSTSAPFSAVGTQLVTLFSLRASHRRTLDSSCHQKNMAQIKHTKGCSKLCSCRYHKYRIIIISGRRVTNLFWPLESHKDPSTLIL